MAKQFVSRLFLLFICFEFMISVTSAKTPISQGNFSCFTALQNTFNHFLTSNFLNLTIYMPKNYVDLGNMEGCTKSGNRYIRLEIGQNPFYYITVGFCFPFECTSDYLMNPGLRKAIAKTLNKYINASILNITEDNVFFVDAKKKLQSVNSIDFWDGIGLGVMGFIILISIICTLVIYCSKNGEKKYKNNALISSFNMSDNIEMIMDTENKKDVFLNVIHGLRVISMAWIILGHSLAQMINIPITNSADFYNDLANSTAISYVSGATVSVDIFFVLSAFFGVIVIASTFKNLKRRNIPTIIIMIITRYIRLLPVYIFGLIFACCVLPLLSYGPIFDRIWEMRDICRNYWYYNLLYINNFISALNLCLDWTWYLPCDFQFFLILPFIIWIYLINKKVGYTMISFIAIVSFGLQAYVYFKYKMTFAPFDASMQNNFEKYYERPYTRINTYLFGVVLGFFYLSGRDPNFTIQSIENMKQKIKSSTSVRWIMYITGFILFNATFIINSLFKANTQRTTKDYIYIILYSSLSRPLFCLTVFLFVFPAMYGKARFINLVLGHDFFCIISKLTYGAYMIHLGLFYFMAFSIETSYYYTFIKLVQNAISIFVISYLISFFITLFFDNPVAKLSKHYLELAKKQIEHLSPNKSEENDPLTTDNKSKV